jgi:murein DD-endopeptidase MepM/ murein hydrolase activator NlpD
LPAPKSDGNSQLLTRADSLYARGGEEVRRVPQTRLELGVTRANEGLQAARERAGLLLDSPTAPGALGLDPLTAHTSRRAAARWITRYSTHLVVLLIVGALVAFGGLRTATVEGEAGLALLAAGQYNGTDHFEDEHDTENGEPHVDDMEFEIVLPRTELGRVDVPANPAPSQPSQPSQPTTQEGANAAPQEEPAGAIRYVVAEGETINGIARKMGVMPETVMGSNGIFDSEEALAAGREMWVPPVDGIYHVAAEGETLDSVARRYQADPASIAAYKWNNIGADGAIKPGQPLIVPGGMMPARETTLVYTVKRGDSLRDIAARFGVDTPTLMHANEIPDADNLRPGSQLRVLPVPGLEHKVKKGDTINTIAERFGVTPQMILDYEPNHLNVESTLRIDQVIMVPGGDPEERVTVAAARLAPSARGESRPPEKPPARPEPPKAEKPKAATQPKAAAPKAANVPKAATGRMVWPVSGRITQYFSRRHNGLDIAIRAGTPIHAADAGKVIWSGWRRDGLGYCVIINHGNGLTTIYGHMLRQPPVYVGQYVGRGQTIGLIGSTGRSTGPHVHFMVKTTSGAYRNPLSYLGR